MNLSKDRRTTELILEMNYLAIVAAAVAAFVISMVWYIVFGNTMTKLQGMKPETIASMEKTLPV
jgi:hypothetical protein